MYKVTKELKWEAAHRLFKYDGLCAHIHGHSYRAEITLHTNKLDNMQFVTDFGDIKKTIGKWIDEQWDHAILLNDMDPLGKLLRKRKLRVFSFASMNPTAEVMAKHLYDIANVFLAKDNAFWVDSVKVWETATSHATYGPANDFGHVDRRLRQLEFHTLPIGGKRNV